MTYRLINRRGDQVRESKNKNKGRNDKSPLEVFTVFLQNVDWLKNSICFY